MVSNFILLTYAAKFSKLKYTYDRTTSSRSGLQESETTEFRTFSAKGNRLWNSKHLGKQTSTYHHRTKQKQTQICSHENDKSEIEVHLKLRIF